MELVNKLHEDFSASYVSCVSSIFFPVVVFGQAEIFILLVYSWNILTFFNEDRVIKECTWQKNKNVQNCEWEVSWKDTKAETNV
jgi:hypothetical protein